MRKIMAALTWRFLDSYAPGKIYRVGEAEIQISEPCKACENLKVLSYIGEEKKAGFIKALTWKEEGAIIKKGDAIEELS